MQKNLERLDRTLVTLFYGIEENQKLNGNWVKLRRSRKSFNNEPRDPHPASRLGVLASLDLRKADFGGNVSVYDAITLTFPLPLCHHSESPTNLAMYAKVDFLVGDWDAAFSTSLVLLMCHSPDAKTFHLNSYPNIVLRNRSSPLSFSNMTLSITSSITFCTSSPLSLHRSKNAISFSSSQGL